MNRLQVVCETLARAVIDEGAKKATCLLMLGGNMDGYTLELTFRPTTPEDEAGSEEVAPGDQLK